MEKMIREELANKHASTRIHLSMDRIDACKHDFLAGYDYQKTEIDLLTDQLKQLESQLLAQKTLNEVTVEYLEGKFKRAEEALEKVCSTHTDVAAYPCCDYLATREKNHTKRVLKQHHKPD
jgi:hypothetical protein